MLAYVFWHWKQPDIAVAAYEQRQQAFHVAFMANPSPGFRGSFSSALTGAPWAAAGSDAYEDWYLVDDFAALGELNQGAVSAQRSAPHDAAAAVVADGSGGACTSACSAGQGRSKLAGALRYNGIEDSVATYPGIKIKHGSLPSDYGKYLLNAPDGPLLF